MSRRSPRARVKQHLHDLVTFAATTTLTTTACACDMLPAPARIQLDGTSVKPQAVLVEDAGAIYVDVTIPSSGVCAFDSTFAEVEGALVVKVTGGSTMAIRLHPTATAKHIAGVIACSRTDVNAVRDKIRLDIDLVTAPALPAQLTVAAKTVSEDPPP